MARKATKSAPPSLDEETLQLGRELWTALDDRRPTIFDRRWWLDHLLEWAMSDPTVKVQMFRFVDVLPTLKSSESIAQHLQEYFEDVQSHLPLAARLALEVGDADSLLGKALAVNARNNVRKMAERFIAGSDPDQVYQSVNRLRRQGLAFTLDLLGEAVISEPEAEAYQRAYLDLLTNLSPLVEKWPENDLIDRDDTGFIPRCQVSLKLSALYSQFKPIDPVRSSEAVKARLRPILLAARENEAYVHVDMEQSSYKGLTQQIFREVLLEDEFRDWSDVGIVIQAYLEDAEADLLKFREWVDERGTPISIRLVKGAYWDYETIHAEYRGWQAPVFRQKWKSDANFEMLTRRLFEERQWLRPQIASHNLRSLAHAVTCAKQLDVPKEAWEIQMLYGMAEEQASLFAERGHRVRIYTPFGDLLPGMAYLVRRLLENTSNDSFLKHAYDRDLPIEELLRNPEEVGARMEAERKAAPMTSIETAPLPEFTNEPPTDFSIPENREAMQVAIDDVASQLGADYPLVINGKAVDTRARITSKNPSHKKQAIGTSASAGVDHADQAVEAAQRAWRQWSRTPATQRADYLEVIAAEMRNQKFELAAWEVHECGKSWVEADGDVAEAIDFCMYYAHLMRELDTPLECDAPGEENSYLYRPRGVCAVIAPWNFPLAILCGMTVASLVTGNTVVMKPSEQSIVVAAKFMEILRDAGIPDGVVNYLPGVGEEVGPALVSHPDVDVIAFTGSQAVGLSINQLAAQTDPRQQGVKRVIAEMGGKNAIIVDEDADLDEAVVGILHSAFGYSGQKCSACSRVVVHQSVYEAFLARLQPAVEALIVGPAEDPGTVLGPVIDEEAQKRINDYIALGTEEHRVVVSIDIKALAKEGYFVAPHVFADVPPDSRLAQQEIFGPVLCVIPAKDFDEAIDIANQTSYALTAGVYSRSPKNLEIARQELQAGNLYLNRPITGALVQRQPFGGFKMSGVGSKAGGRDYLLQFLIPVNVTENTLRRGFAPPAKGGKKKA